MRGVEIGKLTMRLRIGNVDVRHHRLLHHRLLSSSICLDRPCATSRFRRFGSVSVRLVVCGRWCRVCCGRMGLRRIEPFLIILLCRFTITWWSLFVLSPRRKYGYLLCYTWSNDRGGVVWAMWLTQSIWTAHVYSRFVYRRFKTCPQQYREILVRISWRAKIH